MPRVERAHRFEVPLERGFSFITDPRNWPQFWPGLVRLDPTSKWSAEGDTARLTAKLVGREVELTMKLERFEPNSLVTYTSVQRGLPDARHERHFERNGEGFAYRLVTEFDPRPGPAGIYDRLILPAGIGRAFRRTFADLDRAFAA